MNNIIKSLSLALTLLPVLAITPSFSAKETSTTPLKALAPDLVIYTAEQGEFLNDPADPRNFKATATVKADSGLFGWRMKVKTTRKTVLVQEKNADKGKNAALPMHLKPEHDYLFAPREIVQGASKGSYSMTVWVENVPVKTFKYTVQ